MEATMKLILLLMVLLFVDVAFSQDQCHTSECKDERRNAWIMKGYQHEIKNYKKIIQESSCSVCSINGFTPCHNNGTCNVGSSPTNYTCDCPDNTTGANCETILSCQDENPCGLNAECVILNHQKKCHCPQGYAGDPTVNCTLQQKTAHLSGDPHFITFDGTSFDYMGTCPYYLMKACDPSIDFSIQATSTILPEWNYKTWTKNLVFKTQGLEFRVDQNMILYVRNQSDTFYSKSYPFYYPSDLDATISVTKPAETVIITDTITQAVITFSFSLPYNASFAPVATATVTVPLTPFFYGYNTMCGLFGNIDDTCTNDIRTSNGTVLEISNCSIGINATVASYADTWVFNSTIDSCIEGEVFFNNTNCNITVAQPQCDLIRQAIDGLGPFGACQAMGTNLVDKLYHDCTYDICNSQPQCDVLDRFAKLCLIDLPFANLDTWRTSTFCPYTCPPYSHYSLKTPSCQNSCADVNYSNSSTCQESYQEGCICDPGYYFDSNGQQEGFAFVCRPLDECGCRDSKGNYYLPNHHWINADCTIAYKCFDANLTSQSISCSANGQCTNIRGKPTCQCLTGYTGDGFNCTDIDECADPSICSVNLNQGKCTNLPGTYNCTCFAPYSGSQCSEYTPRRHCADLQLFHGITENGAYSISIGAEYGHGITEQQLNWTEVYCDMENADGGWTLMSHGNITNGKTFVEYVKGFGDPTNAEGWLGLENIHVMTALPTSLRVIIESCPQSNKPIIDCTYESFIVTDLTNRYSVLINNSCQSNSNDTTNIDEGWAIWDKTQMGPVFSTFDQDDTYNCSNTYYKTGWWFGNRCGIANLNGLHFICGDNLGDYLGQYLSWDGKPIKDAHMFLRPKAYPHYDSHYN